MANHCEFYEYRSSFLSGKDWCNLTNEEVSRETYKTYCEYYSSSKDCPRMRESGHGSSSCFLTSACVWAKNLPDNCQELETLRKFRDSYVMGLPNGNEIIKEYYEVAPKIVSAIEQRPDSTSIFKQMYEKLVLGCVKLIEARENEDACRLYQNSLLRLKKEFL